MSHYQASRWVISRNLIFPLEINVEKFHVRTRKRRFPLFWILNEESIPLTKVASIKIHKGLIFSDMIIENSGGDFPIKIIGVTNSVAHKIRAELETKEREIARNHRHRDDIDSLPAPPDFGEEPSFEDEYDVIVH